MKTATSAVPRNRATTGSVPARSLARRKKRANGNFIWQGKPSSMRIDIAPAKPFGEVIHNWQRLDFGIPPGLERGGSPPLWIRRSDSPGHSSDKRHLSRMPRPVIRLEFHLRLIRVRQFFGSRDIRLDLFNAKAP